MHNHKVKYFRTFFAALTEIFEEILLKDRIKCEILRFNVEKRNFFFFQKLVKIWF